MSSKHPIFPIICTERLFLVVFSQFTTGRFLNVTLPVSNQSHEYTIQQGAKPMQLHTIKAGPLKVRSPLSAQGLCALGVLALGCGIRLTLIALGWPHTNFDEGTVGQMAMNIA